MPSLRGISIAVAACAALLSSSRAPADGIVLDGTLGGGGGGSLGGPHFDIGAELGQQLGANLFFSFLQFNLAQGESATFSGPADVARIISRVTGGSPSQIDGLLRSTIAGADFYFINPAGVVFGADASVDVGGSLYVSSAHYLTLGGGGRFDAADPQASTLTSAPPEAFGFLGGQGSIVIDGGTLVANPGASLSVIGGDVTLQNGGQLVGQAGRINVAATRNVNEIAIGADGIEAAAPLDGTLRLDGSGIADYGSDALAPGSIHLAAGRVELAGSTLQLQNFGDADSGDIHVDAASAIDIEGVDESSDGIHGIYNDAYVGGDAGNIFISAPSITLGNFAWIASQSFGGAGAGGEISLAGGDVLLAGGGEVMSLSYGDGATGGVRVDASHALTLTGGSDAYSSAILSQSYGSGAPGGIDVVTSQLSLSDGGVIMSLNFGGSDAAPVNIHADDIHIESRGSIQTGNFNSGDGADLIIDAIHSLTLTGHGDFDAPGTGTGGNIQTLIETGNGGSGRGGDVRITTPSLVLDDAAQISSDGFYFGDASAGEGAAGSLIVDAVDVRFGGQATMTAETSGTGRGGNIVIHASHGLFAAGVDPRSAAYFGNLSESGVVTYTFADGAAGDISIVTPQLDLSSFANVISETYGSATGIGGAISIDTQRITLESGGLIDANAFGGDSRNIDVRASESITIVGDPDAPDGFGTGMAGDSYSFGHGASLHITTPLLIMDANAVISVDAFASGDAGSIIIDTADLVLTHASAIYAAAFQFSATGRAGDIDIHASHAVTLSGDDDSHESLISIQNNSSGAGGTLHIATPSLTIGSWSLLNADNFGPNADGGRMVLDVGDLEVESTGDILASVNFDPRIAGSGIGGGPDLLINAAHEVHIASGGAMFTEALGQDAGSGAGGLLHIDTPLLVVDAGGFISAETNGPGQGGKIEIVARDADIAGTVTARSIGTADGSGDSGSISFDVAHDLRLLPGALIVTQSANSAGGNIDLQVGHLLDIEQSQVTTSANGGSGRGGNIHIGDVVPPPYLVLNGSDITANAFGGPGGNILITAGNFLKSADSTLSASSALGVNGDIEITAPIIDVGSGLDLQPAEFLDASRLLHESCSLGAGDASSSFVAVGRGGFPETSNGPLYVTPHVAGADLAFDHAGARRVAMRGCGHL